eukprot:7062907-Alexandrium_andersonii.AAC.1
MSGECSNVSWRSTSGLALRSIHGTTGSTTVRTDSFPALHPRPIVENCWQGGPATTSSIPA